jgi:hypothetical protein
VMERQDRTDEAIYVFCLARAGSLETVQAPGMDPHSPLLVHHYRDIAAVLNRVAARDFCGTSGEANLQDLQWIAPRACQHEQVVEQVMHLSPVLPARFGTLFRSLGSVERSLRQHYEPITRFLNWVSDKQELGVKGLFDRNQAREYFFDKALAETSQAPASSPGKRYFQEQRMRMQIEKEILGWLKTVTQLAIERLTPFSAERQPCRLLPADGPASQQEMFLNWAFLVPRENKEAFCTQVDQLNAEEPHGMLTFRLTGPWPPYSFTPSLNEAGSR